MLFKERTVLSENLHCANKRFFLSTVGILFRFDEKI